MRRTGASKTAPPPRSSTSQFGALPSASIPLSRPSGPISSVSKLSPNPKLELEPEELATIEQNLSKFIGPMAKMLVRKEASRQTSFKHFIAAVAETIDNLEQRDQFLHGLKRVLARRNH